MLDAKATEFLKFKIEYAAMALKHPGSAEVPPGSKIRLRAAVKNAQKALRQVTQSDRSDGFLYPHIQELNEALHWYVGKGAQ